MNGAATVIAAVSLLCSLFCFSFSHCLCLHTRDSECFWEQGSGVTPGTPEQGSLSLSFARSQAGKGIRPRARTGIRGDRRAGAGTWREKQRFTESAEREREREIDKLWGLTCSSVHRRRRRRRQQVLVLAPANKQLGYRRRR